MGEGYITRPAAWGQQGRKGRVQATIKSTLSSQLMITTSMDHLNGVLKLPCYSKQCLLLWTGGWQVRMSGWKEMECKTLQVVHSPLSNSHGWNACKSQPKFNFRAWIRYIWECIFMSSSFTKVGLELVNQTGPWSPLPWIRPSKYIPAVFGLVEGANELQMTRRGLVGKITS